MKLHVHVSKKCRAIVVKYVYFSDFAKISRGNNRRLSWSSSCVHDLRCSRSTNQIHFQQTMIKNASNVKATPAVTSIYGLLYITRLTFPKAETGIQAANATQYHSFVNTWKWVRETTWVTFDCRITLSANRYCYNYSSIYRT